MLHLEESMFISSRHHSFVPVFLLLSALLALFPDFAHSEADYTGALPPAEPGYACDSTQIFSWVVQTKTPFTAYAIVPVPDGMSPQEWSGADAYLESFHQAVGSSGNLSLMAEVLLQLWQQPETARIYVELQRDVTIQNREIRCVDSVWQIVSDSEHTETQSSDWIGLFEDPVQRTTASASGFLQSLEAKLATANNQPGADTRPYHSYTVSQ
jgi:hypothetical protein